MKGKHLIQLLKIMGIDSLQSIMSVFRVLQCITLLHNHDPIETWRKE